MTEIYAATVHGVLSGPAIERLRDGPIKELILTDTVPLPPEKQIPKITAALGRRPARRGDQPHPRGRLGGGAVRPMR